MDDATSPDYLTAALRYAARGWRVLPVGANKRPLLGNDWPDKTSADPHQVADWWLSNPDALIGVATGNGIVVVDVDRYKATFQADEWEAFVLSHGGLPDTYTVATPSGGTHLYYSTPTPVRNATNLFGGVDFRSDRAQVVAPPSVIPGKGAYRVVSDAPLMPLPTWLAGLASRSRPETSGEVVRREDLTPEQVARGEHYARTVVERELHRLRACREASVQQGEPYSGEPWNQTTYDVACNLIELANSGWCTWTEDDAYQALLDSAPRDSGFTEADVIDRWSSARKKVGDRGRPMPAGRGGIFTPFGRADAESVTYEPASFFVKGEGLDVTRLATAVLELGPLAIDASRNRAIWAYRAGVWSESANEVVDRCSALLGSRFRNNHVTNVLPVIQGKLQADGWVIHSTPVHEYINCRNGMLHWATGKLYPHDPSLLSTVQLPVEWDPRATCPQFDVFVKQVMAPDAVDYLWQLIGYLCYSGNPFQCALLMHGTGANGKGTLLRVLTALLGQHNVSSVTLQAITEGRFEAAEMYGKIANLAGDIDAAYMKNTAKFKTITGEDLVTAERKFDHPFKFTCWATPVFSANEFWKSSDTTEGYTRRWFLLPFPNTFTTEGGQGLTERLVTELPGILMHAVHALRLMMTKVSPGFDVPASARDEKSRFMVAGDQVAEWLSNDECVLVADPKDQTVAYPVAEAYRAYRRWADENGNGLLPSSKWRMRMETLGYGWKKSGVRKLVGLRIDPRMRLYDQAAASVLN